ncbi:MAG TPA: hypothetical protein VN613_12555 [Gemmatimonadaceae bacterium]|nr:hypothetical protein [Gemmatimonadaceae bacterium]
MNLTTATWPLTDPFAAGKHKELTEALEVLRAALEELAQTRRFYEQSMAQAEELEAAIAEDAEAES